MRVSRGEDEHKTFSDSVASQHRSVAALVRVLPESAGMVYTHCGMRNVLRLKWQLAP